MGEFLHPAVDGYKERECKISQRHDCMSFMLDKRY